ncbi:MAG: GatB/YqeY domain-containing protein [Armatimonadetes bacterium]|nr:GatB/YqeY domain-containing protein [Armatimonadota bacterium]
MPIAEQISRDVMTAMKTKDERLGTLRMMKTAMLKEEKDTGKPVDDATAVQLLMKLGKQRRESIDQFEKGGRADLADKERAELQVIEEYLPKAPDEAQVREAVKSAVAKTGADSPKQMGVVMKEVMAAFAGLPVDGKLVSQLVKESLGA